MKSDHGGRDKDGVVCTPMASSGARAEISQLKTHCSPAKGLARAPCMPCQTTALYKRERTKSWAVLCTVYSERQPRLWLKSQRQAEPLLLAVTQHQGRSLAVYSCLTKPHGTHTGRVSTVNTYQQIYSVCSPQLRVHRSSRTATKAAATHAHACRVPIAWCTFHRMPLGLGQPTSPGSWMVPKLQNPNVTP